ncbi:MAG TPA: N-acetylmuramoyl-L-alanine amidase [Nitrospirota bacterium]|nr:N-acetylmuramoyl-L-alanine amidase [Nitrospirota bacterium]
MTTLGRSCTAAFTACILILAFSAPAHPSYNSEAGRKYTIASQRLADLKKSPKKKKYRSYWLDCIRTFEAVEKKYPKSPSAAEACFDRSGVYEDLYRHNRYSKDIEEALQSYAKCQSAYPANARAPEALYHIVSIALDVKKDKGLAAEFADKLASQYPGDPWTAKASARITPASPKKMKLAKKEPPAARTPAAAPAKTKAGTVQKIRYWSGGAYTRIVIEQNQAVTFQAHELKNPDRLVFDLFSTRLGAGVDKDPLPVNDGLLRQVRASQYAPDTVRVVLDLASIKNYVAFALHDPERLVIDVTGEGGNGSESRIASSDSATPQTEPTTSQKQIVKAEPKTEPQTTVPAVPKIPEVKNNEGDRLTLSRQMALKVKTIAIDAGHGGHDPGAIGKGGTKEKAITLDIAKRLAALVKERLGCNVVLTRDRDVFIPLDQRPFIAKSKGADLFVSIHVNANRKRKMRGIETYVQGLKASDREAMATAARENAMSERSLSELDSEVEKMLKDLKIDNKIEESIQLAGSVQTTLVDHIKPHQKNVALNHGVKSAFFYVLMNTNIPSILAEVGYISNPDEEKMLKKDAYRQIIAEALFQGVKNYINAREPQMMGI